MPFVGALKGARGPRMLHMFLPFFCSTIICRLYIQNLSVQTQVTLQLPLFPI